MYAFLPECESYRSFRFPLIWHPNEDPAMAVEGGPDEKVTLLAQTSNCSGRPRFYESNPSR
jgi:hypothetical protein